MPYFFSLNKTNYSRYGAYFVKQLENLDRSHPGCKEIIQSKGLSVQAQDKYPLRTPIDQHGEQTLNKDAKSTGGIKKLRKHQWCSHQMDTKQSLTSKSHSHP